MKRIIIILVTILVVSACTNTDTDKSKRDIPSQQSDSLASADSLLLDEAKLNAYVYDFRKGMFNCRIGSYSIYIDEEDIDNLDVHIRSIIEDGDTTRYFLCFYFLDTCNTCFLSGQRGIGELIRIKGKKNLYPITDGYGFHPDVIKYRDSVNSLTKLQGMEFDDYPYYARRDSFRSFLEVKDRSWVTEEVRSDFLKKYHKKSNLGY